MSEEEKNNTPEVETPKISIPKTEEAATDGDIVASKPDSKERQSAVIGSVDRPMTEQRPVGRGGRGGRGGAVVVPVVVAVVAVVVPVAVAVAVVVAALLKSRSLRMMEMHFLKKWFT